jgi:hypothetical protein
MNLEDLAKRIRDACLKLLLVPLMPNLDWQLQCLCCFNLRENYSAEAVCKANYQYDFRLAFFEHNMR